MAGLIIKSIIALFLLSACEANLKVKSVGGAPAASNEAPPNNEPDDSDTSNETDTLDQIPPIVTAIVPEFINSQTTSLVITGTCSEEERSINMSGAFTATVSCVNGAWSHTIDTTSLVDGPYNFTLSHDDLAGNVQTVNASFIKHSGLPTVADPTISVSSIDGRSVTLSWNKATDTVSPQEALRYKVVYSTSNNVDTVENVEANGTVGLDYTDDIATAMISGLTPQTTYTFNVIAVNEADNKKSYISVTAKTTLDVVAATVGNKALGRSAERKTFFDTHHGIHWAFYHNGTVVSYAYSSDGIQWTQAGALSHTNTSFSVTSKKIGSDSYVFLATIHDQFDVILQRGKLSKTSITWDSPVTVFDGVSLADHYQKPVIALDGNQHLWVAAVHKTSVARGKPIVKRTTQTASDSLSDWQAPHTLTLEAQIISDLALVPRGGSEMYLLTNGIQLVGYVYDGTNWSSANDGGSPSWFTFPSEGLNGLVQAVVILEGELYVGGHFTEAGGVPLNYVAKWNGTSWEALGDGVSHIVSALAVLGSDLYVGGAFGEAGGVPANRVAKWNGTSWSALGSGVNHNVSALAVLGSDLYVGGSFTEAGGVPANRIAKWNGTSWSALGSGVNNSVSVLMVSDSALYVGGSFTEAGEVSANRVAKWNGTSWEALGIGVNSTVTALAVSGSDLYVGGTFTQAGGAPASRIAKWNGTSWSALGSGVNNAVATLAVLGSDLYVGGTFTQAGGVSANKYVAKWNGTSWEALGSGVNNSVHVLTVVGSDLYVGGHLTNVGGVSTSRLAKWNGTSWQSFGTGSFSHTVSALAVSGNDLYVGGNFTEVGGSPADYVAKWNGTSWQALGSGVSGTVSAFAVLGSDLYVGGTFTQAGGVSASRIAKWNGSSWEALGDGVNNNVSVLTVSGNDLYVGGWFSHAGGSPVNYVAKWNGASWEALGDGVNNVVYAIAVLGSDLYVGGTFTQAGGVSASRIAKWNGTSWQALGDGVDNNVSALAVSGSDLYVGGTFTSGVS